MALDDTTLTTPSDGPRVASAATEVPALLVAWSIDDPGLVGAVMLIRPGTVAAFGRGDGGDLQFQRAGRTSRTPPVSSPYLSRHQLDVSADAGGLEISRVGKCPLLYRGRPVDRVRLEPGDVVLLRDRMALACTTRPLRLPRGRVDTGAFPAFGEPDGDGIVGEAPAAWTLRDRVAFVAPRHGHVLIFGPSGAGKELVARAMHRQSPRAGRPWVSRNAATFPEGLIDAELFGSARNYPNAGMPERRGLIGEADGGTLFLDEIGELPDALQSHLLRVLDSGEYQRLGESRVHRSDLRLVGATNRPMSALKEELSARLPLQIAVPGLNARRDDIPLLVRHLLRRIVTEDPQLATGLFPGADPGGHPDVSPAFVARLLRHDWRTHTRELEQLLWRAVSESAGGQLSLPDDAPLADEAPVAEPEELSAATIRQALEANDWVREKVWRALGLPNRYALYRLVKQHGLKRE